MVEEEEEEEEEDAGTGERGFGDEPRTGEERAGVDGGSTDAEEEEAMSARTGAWGSRCWTGPDEGFAKEDYGR